MSGAVETKIVQLEQGTIQDEFPPTIHTDNVSKHKSQSTVDVINDLPQNSTIQALTNDLNTDELASVRSSESSSSWMELRFQLYADAMRFSHFVHFSVIFASMYIMTASTAFFSSLYPVAEIAENQASTHSTVDSFVLTSAIIAIDITSAFFVVIGFFCAYTLTNINSSDVSMLFRIIILHTIIDVWIATLLSVIFGSIFHALLGTFSAHDITLTLIEGITCMRTFELSQSPNAMHSLNPMSWPVLCLLYCFLFTPWTMASNNRLHACYPRAGLLLLLVNALLQYHCLLFCTTTRTYFS
jgi:hypothetical protein